MVSLAMRGITIVIITIVSNTTVSDTTVSDTTVSNTTVIVSSAKTYIRRASVLLLASSSSSSYLSRTPTTHRRLRRIARNTPTKHAFRYQEVSLGGLPN